MLSARRCGVEDALEGLLQRIQLGVDVHARCGPVVVLELLPGRLGLGVVGDPRLVVRDVGVGEHRLRNVPVQLDVRVLGVDGVEERPLEGRVGREGAVGREELTGRGEGRQGLEGGIRMLGRLQKAERVGMELGRDLAVV